MSKILMHDRGVVYDDDGGMIKYVMHDDGNGS